MSTSRGHVRSATRTRDGATGWRRSTIPRPVPRQEGQVPSGRGGSRIRPGIRLHAASSGRDVGRRREARETVDVSVCWPWSRPEDANHERGPLLFLRIAQKENDPIMRPMMRRAAPCLVLSLVALAAVTGSWPAVALAAPQRPPVAGRNAGVSAVTLTTAAAFDILLRAATRSTRASRPCWWAASSSRTLRARGRTRARLPQASGKSPPSSTGMGPQRRHDRVVSRTGKSLQGEGLDPAVVPARSMRPHGARTLGDLELRARCRRAPSSTRATGSRSAPTAQTIERSLTFIKKWPTNTSYWLKPDGSPYAAARRSSSRRSPGRSRGWSRPNAPPDAGAVPPDCRRTRSLLQGRPGPGDGGFLAQHGAPFDRSDFATSTARRGADVGDLTAATPSTSSPSTARPVTPADTQHPRELRPPGRWGTTAPTTSTRWSKR